MFYKRPDGHPADRSRGILQTSEPLLTAEQPVGCDLRTSLIVGLLCLLVYNINLRSISAGDAYPARYVPFAIWRWHTVLKAEQPAELTRLGLYFMRRISVPSAGQLRVTFDRDPVALL